MTTRNIDQMTKFRRLAEQYAKGQKLLTTEERNALMLRRFYGCEADPGDTTGSVKHQYSLRLRHCPQ